VLLAGFDLTQEEQEVVASIESGSIREFAGSLCKWIDDPEAALTLEMDCTAVGA
jgi:hypothetical protein